MKHMHMFCGQNITTGGTYSYQWAQRVEINQSFKELIPEL